MSERTVTRQESKPASEPPPPFDPDDQLMADLEGNQQAVAAYRREAATLRASAATR